MLKSLIVSAKCSKTTHSFCIRFQNRENNYLADWAYVLKGENAHEDVNEKTSGNFNLSPDYPGCPHCRANSFFRCGCGELCCWSGASQETCPTCKVCASIAPTGINYLKAKENG